MKKLNDEVVLRVMREEWTKRLDALCEQAGLEMTANVDGEKDVPVIPPELKVRHKRSRLLYTVSSVGPNDVILRTPEGDEFLVDAQTLEDEYIVD